MIATIVYGHVKDSRIASVQEGSEFLVKTKIWKF